MTHGDGDRHRRLDGEDVVVAPGATALAAQVDDPDFIALLAHPAPHAQEGIAINERTGGDVADDARACGQIMLEGFPQRPAPEVHVQVVQVLQVTAAAGILHRGDEVFQDGVGAIGSFAPAHPAAGHRAVVIGSGGMAVVGRVADADQHRHGLLHALGAAVLQADGPVQQGQLGDLFVRGFQRVGEHDLDAVTGHVAAVLLEHPGQAQRGDGIRPDHELEAIQGTAQNIGACRHRARAFQALHFRHRVLDDAEQVGAGADSRIEHIDTAGGKAHRLVHAPAQQVVGNAYLCLHHLDRCVIGAGVLAQHRVVLGQEILVEMQPGIAPAAAHGAGGHGIDYPLQQTQRGAQVFLDQRIGEHLEGAREQGVGVGQRSHRLVEQQGVAAVGSGQQQ